MTSTDRAQRRRLGRNLRVVAKYDRRLTRETKRIYEFLSENDDGKSSCSDYSFDRYMLWHLQYYDEADINEEEYNIVIEPYFHFQVRPLPEFPPEIRNRIYKFLFSGSTVRVRHLTLKRAKIIAKIRREVAEGHNSGWSDENPFDIRTAGRLTYGCRTNDGVKDILNTCRSVRREARPMLYGAALWDISDPALIETFREEAGREGLLTCIKYLRLGYVVDPCVNWQMRFPKLKVLVLVHFEYVASLEKAPEGHSAEELWSKIVEEKDLGELFESNKDNELNVVLKLRWFSGTSKERLAKEEQCLVDVGEERVTVTPVSDWVSGWIG